jgi:hypothetical protein
MRGYAQRIEEEDRMSGLKAYLALIDEERKLCEKGVQLRESLNAANREFVLDEMEANSRAKTEVRLKIIKMEEEARK